MIKTKSVSRRQWLTGATAVAAVPFALGYGLRPQGAHAADAAATNTPPPIELYGKLPNVSDAALSPNGQRIALLMNQNGGLIVYDFELATGKAAACAIDGDKIRNLMWADNDNVFLTTSKTTKFADVQFEEWIGFIIDVRAGTRYQLYSDLKDYNANVGGDYHRIKVGNDYRITASNYRASGMGITTDFSSALYGFSTKGHRGFRIDEDSRNIQSWVLRPDGTVVARSEYDPDSHIWTLRFKDAKLGWRSVYQVKVDLDPPSLQWGTAADGNSVIVYMSDGPMKDKYVAIAPDGTFAAPYDVDGRQCSPIFSPDTFSLVGFRHVLGIDHYVFYDPAYSRLPALIKHAVGEIHADILSFADDPLHVLVYVEGGGNPGTYYSIDFTAGAYKEIGESYPDIPGEWVADKNLISYKAADGLEIPAYLSLPVDRDAKNLALVVLPHGGPEVFETGEFDWWSQALCSRGYAILQPNYRGSAGYGQDYTAKGFGEFGRKMQTDLSDGVRDLVSQGIVDPKKVCIVGGSYGGYAALAGVSLDPGVYNCAAALAGISDIKTFMDYELQESGYKPDSYTMRYWTRYMGEVSTWDQISPIKHIDAITVPVLLIHGKDDTVVPFDQSTEMRDALQRAGKSVEFVQMKNEDHWLSREATRIEAITAMAAFILKNNPPA